MSEYTANRQLAETPKQDQGELLNLRKPLRFTNDGKPASTYGDPNDMTTWELV